jgi:hypothetical protein
MGLVDTVIFGLHKSMDLFIRRAIIVFSRKVLYPGVSIFTVCSGGSRLKSRPGDGV